MKLNADLAQRACINMHDLAWEDSPSSGVQRLRLERDDDKPPVERVTTIVRFAPGSSFSGHVHGGGEEFLVLDGTFSDQHADYPQGFYVRNPRGTGHAPHSTHGCTILVKLWQMHPDDQQQLAIDTGASSGWQQLDHGGRFLPLFEADYESVCMLEWPAGMSIDAQLFEGGVEYFVLQGSFRDHDGDYHEGTWLRLPCGSRQTIHVTSDCRVFRKSGHLLNPVSYA